MFFSSWMSLLRVVVVGALAYAGLILTLRVAGKRTLAKLNAFDLVVTVALGSAFATILLSKSVALLEGLLAFVTLALLQFGVAKASLRSERVSDLIKAKPRALLRDGALLEAALREERVSRAEVLAAVRGSGAGDLADVAAVVLEADGSLNVVARSRVGDGSALANVL